MTAAIGFPLETVYAITGISNSYPGVVTLLEVTRNYALSVSNQQTITIHNVEGMTELNDTRFIIGNLDTNTKTFSLYDLEGNQVDTTSFHPYIAGGQIDIISFPGNPPGLMYNNVGIN